MRSSAGISLIVFAFSIGTSSFVSGQRPRPVRRRRQKQQLLRIPSDNRNLVVSSALYNEEKEKLSSLELLRGLVEDVVLFSSSSMSMSMQQRLLTEEEEEDDELLIHHRDLDSSLFSMDLSMSMSTDMSTSIISSSSSSSCTVPPPFDTNTDIKIHVIMNILTGEYFDLLVDGMITQGLKMGDEVDINFSDDPNETQSDLILKALENGATAIITVDGGPDTLCGSIVKAIDAGVPVVSFDFEGAVTCSDVGHLLTAQSDFDMAERVLTYAASNVILDEEGDMNTTTAATVAVGYVNDLNYQPLQNRNFVWEVDSEKYGWKQEFFVKDAASYATPEELQGAIMEQLSNTTADNIRFIYAPWDYLAINTLKAIEKSGLSADVDVYGADINNEDIKAMIQPNSAWKATAGGHPKMIGAAILRMSLLQMANQIMKEEKEFIQIPSFLFTQEFLLKENVTNLSDLLDAMPELRLKDIASACWIDPIG